MWTLVIECWERSVAQVRIRGMRTRISRELASNESSHPTRARGRLSLQDHSRSIVFPKSSSKTLCERPFEKLNFFSSETRIEMNCVGARPRRRAGVLQSAFPQRPTAVSRGACFVRRNSVSFPKVSDLGNDRVLERAADRDDASLELSRDRPKPETRLETTLVPKFNFGIPSIDDCPLGRRPSSTAPPTASSARASEPRVFLSLRREIIHSLSADISSEARLEIKCQNFQTFKHSNIQTFKQSKFSKFKTFKIQTAPRTSTTTARASPPRALFLCFGCCSVLVFCVATHLFEKVLPRRSRGDLETLKKTAGERRASVGCLPERRTKSDSSFSGTSSRRVDGWRWLPSVSRRDARPRRPTAVYVSDLNFDTKLETSLEMC